MELGRRGCKVIVNYANSTESAEEVVAAIKKNGSDAASVKANVGVVEDIVRMFEEAVKIFGKLDIVCSNSGVVSFGHVKDVTPEEFDRVFAINTRGQFFVAREAYKHLEIGGRLILMGSITGQVSFLFSFFFFSPCSFSRRLRPWRTDILSVYLPVPLAIGQGCAKARRLLRIKGCHRDLCSLHGHW